MNWDDLFKTTRRAASDATLAERLYAEPAFRSALLTSPDSALRRFELTTPLALDGAVRREMPRSWRLRLDAGRAARSTTAR